MAHHVKTLYFLILYRTSWVNPGLWNFDDLSPLAERKETERTTDWFLKLLPRSHTWSFLLKQEMWPLWSSAKGARKIKFFQHNLHFSCVVVDPLSLKQRRGVWEGYWVITHGIGRLRCEAPGEQGGHNHSPTTGVASESCALQHRQHSHSSCHGPLAWSHCE